LSGLLEEAAAEADAKLLVVRAEGKHFSFGASVEEHLPEKAEAMLSAMGGLITRLARFPYPTLASVQGRCLGGGFELALACGLIVAEEGAVFAAPEIKLGVFAPAASALLVDRLPRGLAEELLFSGRDLGAEDAKAWGLVNRVVPKGERDEAVRAWAAGNLAPHSAASLRQATAAWRGAWAEAAGERLRRLERQYVEKLLPLHDGTEGIRSFLEKRAPKWENR
jgi:cyclohexa-1,5-dienecarbonyl-CoA hydratase